eukprot:Hpha_TRINITY_DN17072_c0_g1::TRINITY_DN17072_c0_g1_i1::g.166065::m.166065
MVAGSVVGATLIPLIKVAGGKPNLLKDVIEALAGCKGAAECGDVVVAALALYDSTDRYHALLKSILAHLGPACFRNAVDKLQPEATPTKMGGGRFADAGSGEDSGKPLEFLRGGTPAITQSQLPVQVAG